MGIAAFGRLALLVAALSALAAAPAAAGDREAILSLLQKHSPDGFYVLDAYSKKAGGTDFMEYWDPSSDDARWDSYNTIVHEIAHGVMAELAERNSILFLASKDERVMVPVTKVFYSREMVDSFPKEIRTFRFDYIDCKEDNLGAQAQGAYGLLDEMNAYFLGTKTSWDLLPHFQSMGAQAPWGSFFQAVNGTLYGILEFKLYVLKYLMYARDSHPDVYEGIMSNGQFAKAFIAVDRASSSFIKDYFARKGEVYASIRKLGLEAREEGNGLAIGTSQKTRYSGTFIDVYSLLSRELEKREYQDIMKALNGGKAVAASPVVGPPDKLLAMSESSVTSASIGTGGGGVQRQPAAAARTAPSQVPPAAPAPAAGAKPSTASSAGPPPAAGAPPSRPAAAAPAAMAMSPQPAPAAVQKKQMDSAFASIDSIRASQGRNQSAAPALTRSGEDALGDVETGFIDISRADLRVYPDLLVVGISYSAFPGKLLFRNPNLKDDSLEYEWAVSIDVEGDGKPDFMVSMASFKPPKSEPIEASVTLFCQADLWKLTASGGEVADARVRAESSGSALFLALADSAALPLKSITAKTRFEVRTYYNNGKSVSEDVLGL